VEGKCERAREYDCAGCILADYAVIKLTHIQDLDVMGMSVSVRKGNGEQN